MNWLIRKEVFISYSRVDKEFAEWLARALEPEYKVWFDKWKMEAGKPFPNQIRKGLKKSFAGLVVFSPDAIKSEMVAEESRTLYRQSLQRKDRKFIPLHYRDCEIPSLLGDIHWIDFRDNSSSSREDSLGRLRSELRKRPWPLVSIAVVLLIVLVCIPAAIKAGIDYSRNDRTRESLRQTQRGVQELELRLASVTESHYALKNGRRDYVDPASGERRLTDTWENGQLVFRNFYAENRLIARDSFKYAANGEVNEKIRSYLDDTQRVYLIDRFTQTGVLTMKRFCRAGPERDCDVYVDDMLSPLPPPWLMSYR